MNNSRYSRRYYPPELFSINEDQTRRNIREYDRKREKWYKTAEQLFPNYYTMPIRERAAARQQIDAAAGFSI